ncbi:unnamed protein product [Pneumocystis jirovecii]|uniref:Uncharacterized protein n=1 Tax=Pneumocystis jirovecii TaxID=42068 RepID=L0PCA0_PNEJI|nr:unnamed protein product [Pneumocystis jirovecii]
MQLKQSILPLQQRIQHLVYAHSRALFFRKGNVNTIRTDILKTMIALKDVQNAIHQCLNKQLKFKTEGLEKLDQWKNEQQYLSMYIREKEKSDENFKLISSLVQKKDKLAQEINETEIKLAEKKNDLKNILNHIEELHNSFGTRFSKEKSRLAEISADETRFIEQFKKLIPHSNQEKSRDALREILFILNILHYQRDQSYGVARLFFYSSCKVSEIINIIDKGLLRLRDLTRIVNNQHLNLLYIAIGYEIEALNRTRRVILSTEDKFI